MEIKEEEKINQEDDEKKTDQMMIIKTHKLALCHKLHKFISFSSSFCTAMERTMLGEE